MKRPVTALDASVLVAHLSSADPWHEQGSALLRDAAVGDMVVHGLNLAEVLVGGARTGRAQQMLADVRAIGVRTLEQRPDEPLQLAELRSQTGLKLPDCCGLYAALVSDAALATFDAGLAKAAAARGVPVVGARS